jgi:tetratricopeptide (TPR) repeat protein
MGKNNEAISCFTQAIRISPRDAEAYRQRAFTFERMGNRTASEDDYKKAMRRDPEFADLYTWRRQFLPMRIEPERTLARCLKVLQRSPRDPEALLGHGLSHYYMIHYSRSIKDLSESVRVSRDADSAYFFRGMIHARQGHLDDALADFSKAISINSRSADVYGQRGQVFSWKNEFDKAAADFTTAIRLDPKNAWHYYNKGIMYEKKGDVDKAVACLSDAIKRNPDLWHAYSSRSRLYEKLGKKNLAQADREKAAELTETAISK